MDNEDSCGGEQTDSKQRTNHSLLYQSRCTDKIATFATIMVKASEIAKFLNKQITGEDCMVMTHSSLSSIQPFSLVFIPSLHDIHQDHTTIAQEGLRAFKNTTLLGYELIWNNLTFNTQCFVKLNKTNISTKIEALKEYHSQGKRDYLSEDFIYSLARTRGVQAGCEYAEAFEVVRLFL